MKLKTIILFTAGIAFASTMVEAKGGSGECKGNQEQKKDSGQCSEESEKTQEKKQTRKQENTQEKSTGSCCQP